MKKLLVILGAGSSVGLRLPSVATIDALMQGWAAAWPQPNLGQEDYYAAVERGMRAYIASSTASNQHRSVNFETILGDLAALANWVTPAPHGTTLQGLTGKANLGLQFPAGRYGAAVAVNDQLTMLLVQLAKHMRGQSQAIDAASQPAADYAALLDGLRRRFDVGIYNLNYDTAALTAWPGAFTGFDANGGFSPRDVHGRQDWGFIYHLHGSVHHSLSNVFGYPIVWKDDLSAGFDDGEPHRSTGRVSDGKEMPKTTLVAGGFKLDQLLVEPFHSFQASLIRHAHEADAVLIGGYGFGDTHVNRALSSRLERGTGQDRPPAMILGYAGRGTDSIHFRRDDWVWNMTQTLLTDGHFFSEAGYGPSPADPCELAQRRAFDLADVHKTAIWYGGFEQAAARVDDIAAWLDGSSNDVLRASRP